MNLKLVMCREGEKECKGTFTRFMNHDSPSNCGVVTFTKKVGSCLVSGRVT